MTQADKLVALSHLVPGMSLAKVGHCMVCAADVGAEAFCDDCALAIGRIAYPAKAEREAVEARIAAESRLGILEAALLFGFADWRRATIRRRMEDLA
jgi:hypothetical protein